VLLGGKLVHGGANFTIDCSVRDMTDQGARVRLAGDVPLPEQVWLIVVNTGKAHEADVAWRTDREVGLRFLNEVDLTQTHGPGGGHPLRRIWLEAAAR